MTESPTIAQASSVIQRPYTSSLLGNINAHLASLQGYDVMALELIQNADDAGANRIVFDVTDEALLVYNSAEFSNCSQLQSRFCPWEQDPETPAQRPCDFHGLAEVSSGAKVRDPENIGRFGVGFVSVYQISDRPEVVSSGIRFVLIPEEEICEVYESVLTEGTRFTLSWARDPDSTTRRRLGASAVADSDLDAVHDALVGVLHRSLLFLQHVTSAEVRRNGITSCTCTIDRDTQSGRLIVELSTAEKPEEWLVLRGDAGQAVASLREKYPRLDEAARSTVVKLAIPLGRQDPFAGLFYAYLPTEQTTGLPVHINADFFPNSDRKSITLGGGKHQQEWNEALIRCAATELADALPTMPAEMPARQIWGVLSAASELADQVSKGQTPSCFSLFWESIEGAMARKPAICWNAAGRWVTCESAYFPPDDYPDGQVTALRELGVELTHPSLRPYRNVLVKGGVPLLTLGALSGKVAGSPRLDALVDGPLVARGFSKRVLLPLWEVLEDLLERVPGDVVSRQSLAQCPIALLDDDRLVRLRDSYRLPQGLVRKRVRELLPELPLAGAELSRHDNLLSLATPLTLSVVNAYLEARIKAPDDAVQLLGTNTDHLGKFYRFLRDVAATEADGSSPQELQRLASIPIFRGGDGFVSASASFLPGDFSDPLGITNILDPACLDAVTLEFLKTGLNVQEQSLESFVCTQIPHFFETEPATEKYGRLLRELARHPELVEAPKLLDTLRALKMIPIQNGEWNRPQHVYHRTKELEALLGDDPAWWLDATRLPKSKLVSVFLDHLGVRREPSAAHLIGQLEQLAESDPTPEAQKASEKLFFAICDHFDQWKLAEDEDFEMVESLKELKVFPASEVYDEWFLPSELHAPDRSEAFASQVHVLSFSRGPRLKREVLELLGFIMSPRTETVIAHLQHCAENNEPAHYYVYQILNERSATEAEQPRIARLRNSPCIFEPKLGTYLRPNQLFWVSPNLGAYAFRVPVKLDDFRQFLQLVGVKDSPTASDCLSILRDIAERFGDTGAILPEQERVVVRSCLWTITEALETGDEETRDALIGLRDVPCMTNLRAELCYADELVVRDSDWHAQAFGRDLDGRLTEPNLSLRAVSEFLGIPLLSEVVTPSVEYRDGERIEEELRARLTERADLICRVMHDQPLKILIAIRTTLATIGVVACETLRVQFHFRHGDVNISSPPQPGRAVYEKSENTLYVLDHSDHSIWSDVFRAFFHIVAAGGSTQDFPQRIYIAKKVMTAGSVDEAGADLSEAGFPDLADDWDHDSVGPASDELGGIGSELDEEQLVEDSCTDETTTDEVGEPTHGSTDEEEEVQDDSGKTTADNGTTGTPRVTEGSASPSGADRGGAAGGSKGGTGASAGGAEVDAKRRGRARSRRDRLRSYVRPPDDETEDGDAGSERDNTHGYAVEDAARSVVCTYERRRGREPEEMSRTHPGYDILSRDPTGNVVRIIEVKGLDGEWTEFGAGVRRLQFSNAWEEGDKYWLYVVEFAFDPEHARVHAIQNPAMKVDEFFFDQNWRGVAESGQDDLRAAFVAGARVRHKGLLGTGTIRERNERGHSVELIIDFDRGGPKPLALNLTTLEVITGEEETDGDDLS